MKCESLRQHRLLTLAGVPGRVSSVGVTVAPPLRADMARSKTL